jgi:hypothetical protein
MHAGGESSPIASTSPSQSATVTVSAVGPDADHTTNALAKVHAHPAVGGGGVYADLVERSGVAGGSSF